MNDIAAQRQSLRRAGLAAREALTPEVHDRCSSRIQQHLAALLLPMSPRRLAFCWPYRAEFDARPLVCELLAAGWQAALPVIDTADTPMVFRTWHADTQMQLDRHGIPFPADGEAILPQLLLLPFNALDRQGYRLGYGAGYFDRTLAVLAPRPLIIGVGFDCGLVDSALPQSHDIPVDCVVTESGLQVFRP